MWEMIKDAIFACIQFFYNFCLDWGMAIIIITVIFRLLITPLMYTQSKSTYKTQKLQPKIKELQERFADDPMRLQQEQQKLYAEAKFNPLASCIPMLIQMPIFIALFQVLREMDQRVVSTSQATDYCFYNLVPNLVQTPAGAFDLIGTDGVFQFIPYITLLLIFAFATFVPSLLNMKNQDKQQRNQMMLMMVLMTVMMLFIGWSSPAGVLLFWGVSSLLAIAQQHGSLAIVKRKEAAAEAAKPAAAKPVEIEVDRKPKKKRQHKKR